MGFVALAFASCVSDKEVAPQTQDQKYQAAFENLVGGAVNANVNWGFDNQQGATFDTDGKYVGMRASQPESNRWGMYMIVPTEMTPEQKAKVKKYFDEVQKPKGISVNWSDFFVHQVSQTARGAYMNYLYCGEKDYVAKDHVFNFNGGSATNKKNVGIEPKDANNARQVDYTDGIMLVQNSSTELFAFHNSYDDTFYEENFVMVSGEMIDEVYPEEPSVAGMWFVGFDYEHHKQKDNETRDDVERDNFFNDWVIRVSPGFYRNSKRVMAEDLIDSSLDNVNISDWDFNDAVFDVAFMTSTEWINNSSVTKITDTIITLWAAGGTKKLYVGGKEVHELFGQPVTTMINTNADGGVDGLTPVIFRVSNPAEPNANLIPLYVNNIELTAKQGEATQKFEVPNTTRWMKERKIITGSYTKFQEYVRNNDPIDWYKTVASTGDLY